MAQYVQISSEEMDSFMDALGFRELSRASRGLTVKEKVYERPFNLGRIRVYSSVDDRAGRLSAGRKMGRDAIRVQYWIDDTKVFGAKRVHRVVNWRRNMLDRVYEIEDMFGHRPVPRDSSGEPMVVRTSKHGKKFWGSRTFPRNKDTRRFNAEREYKKIMRKYDPATGDYNYYLSAEGATQPPVNWSIKKQSCCCGATIDNPCACMYKGVMTCRADEPKCPCYAAKTEVKEAVVIAPRKPTGIVDAVMMNHAMMEEVQLQQMLNYLENMVQLGLLNEEEVMKELYKTFGSEYYFEGNIEDVVMDEYLDDEDYDDAEIYARNAMKQLNADETFDTKSWEDDDKVQECINLWHNKEWANEDNEEEQRDYWIDLFLEKYALLNEEGKQKVNDDLEQSGIGAETFQARLKVCHICGMDKTKLYYVGKRGLICGECSQGGKTYRAETDSDFVDKCKQCGMLNEECPFCKGETCFDCDNDVCPHCFKNSAHLKAEDEPMWCACGCAGKIADHDDRGYGCWPCIDCGDDSDTDINEVCSSCVGQTFSAEELTTPDGENQEEFFQNIFHDAQVAAQEASDDPLGHLGYWFEMADEPYGGHIRDMLEKPWNWRDEMTRYLFEGGYEGAIYFNDADLFALGFDASYPPYLTLKEMGELYDWMPTHEDYKGYVHNYYRAEYEEVTNSPLGIIVKDQDGKTYVLVPEDLAQIIFQQSKYVLDAEWRKEELLYPDEINDMMPISVGTMMFEKIYVATRNEGESIVTYIVQEELIDEEKLYRILVVIDGPLGSTHKKYLEAVMDEM